MKIFINAQSSRWCLQSIIVSFVWYLPRYLNNHPVDEIEFVSRYFKSAAEPGTAPAESFQTSRESAPVRRKVKILRECNRQPENVLFKLMIKVWDIREPDHRINLDIARDRNKRIVFMFAINKPRFPNRYIVYSATEAGNIRRNAKIHAPHCAPSYFIRCPMSLYLWHSRLWSRNLLSKFKETAALLLDQP